MSLFSGVPLRKSTASVISTALLLPACGFLPPIGASRLPTDLFAVQSRAPDHWLALPQVSKSASTHWVQTWGSSKLESLVHRAIEANPDLKAAEARVRQTRAIVTQEGASQLPQIGASGLANRSQSPSDQRFAGINQIANRFNWTINVAWEIDFWGMIADQRRGATQRMLAEAETWHAARLSLAAQTVQAAITLTEAENLRDLAVQNVTARRTELGILEKQLERGLDPDRAALDVTLSRADLARAESTLHQRSQTADSSRRTLETLMGDYPAGLEKGIGTLPTLRGPPPAGLPSEMLLRRPDLRAAERRVAAALAEESAAKKALLPSFRLTTASGRTSQEIERLIRPETALWNLATQAAQALFQGGRLKAGIDLEKARYDENLQNYASSVLTALHEVETALAADRYLSEQEAAQSQASKQAETAEKLAQGQYEKGLTEVLTLLDARQRAFDAKSALISIRAQRLRNRATLHLALGGDFAS